MPSLGSYYLGPGVYMMISPLGETYIGRSQDIFDRIRQHRYAWGFREYCPSSASPMLWEEAQRCRRQGYGYSDWEIKILSYNPDDEIAFIDQYDPSLNLRKKGWKMATYTREDLDAMGLPSDEDISRLYRAGYLPEDERRERNQIDQLLLHLQETQDIKLLAVADALGWPIEGPNAQGKYRSKKMERAVSRARKARKEARA